MWGNRPKRQSPISQSGSGRTGAREKDDVDATDDYMILDGGPRTHGMAMCSVQLAKMLISRTHPLENDTQHGASYKLHL